MSPSLGKPCTRAQVTTLEQQTEETVNEMEKLRVMKDQESTEIHGKTAKSCICSTTITKDVEEPGSEQWRGIDTTAVSFSGGLDEYIEGNPYNQSKTEQ